MDAVRQRSLATSAIGTTVFFVFVPMTVAGWIPYAISGWAMHPPFLGTPLTRIAGGALVAAGAAALIECFVRFAVVGRGTPAPVAPPENLVVTGLYRFTRNPMYVAVLTTLLGQALLLADAALLEYAAIFSIVTHTFVVFYEEPTLRRQFDGSYDDYRAHVPRWFPRLHPWTPTAASHGR
jgi:protein-S-isoprenylcysteine O-methyltransferase Ste14